MKNRIAIACDHAGPDVKNAIIKHLEEKGYEVTDFGCDGSVSVNYPEYADYVCKALESGSADFGILVCGTGIGMSMAANKHIGIRAALCENEFSTEMTRRHNNANVICLGARVMSAEKAVLLTDIFLSTEYEGGRHEIRVEMLNAFDYNKANG